MLGDLFNRLRWRLTSLWSRGWGNVLRQVFQLFAEWPGNLISLDLVQKCRAGLDTLAAGGFSRESPLLRNSPSFHWSPLKKKKFYPRLGHFSSTNVIWIEFDGSNVTMTCECVIFQRAEMKAHLIRFQLRHGVDISVSLCVCVCCIQLGTVIFSGRKKRDEKWVEREKENIDGRRRQFPPPAPPRELCSCWMRPRRDYKTCARLWGRRARPPQTIDLCRDDEDLPLWKPRTRHT